MRDLPSACGRLLGARAGGRASLQALGALALAVPLAAASAQTNERPQLLGRYAHWAAYQHGVATDKVCFAITQARDRVPAATAATSNSQVLLSVWPRQGVKGELSFKLGYKAKAGAPLTAAAGTATFRLFLAEDRAYIADATSELKLLEAMRKGARLVLQGTSADGTAVSETFSLAGLSPALQAATQSCP